MPTKKNISIIGSGNVATQLGLALKKNGWTIECVYNHKISGAKNLANKLNAQAISKLKDLPKSDILIICVKDDVLTKLVNQLSLLEIFANRIKSPIVVHTSGTVPIEILSQLSINFGWLYPLQSIKKNEALDFRKVPIGIDGSTNKALATINQMGRSISKHTFRIKTHQRSKLHLAAVFTNNFTNHLLAIAQSIAKENNIDFKILVPLLAHTFEVASKQHSANHQTGPAIRGDKNTIKVHMDLLKHSPYWRAIYKAITQSIAHTR